MQHAKKKPSHKKKTKKGHKKSQKLKAKDLEGALSSSITEDPLELQHVTKKAHSPDTDSIQSLTQSNQTQSSEASEASE